MNKSAACKFFMVFVGVSGAFSVLFGAWLAHVGVSLPQKSQTTLHTALFYQFIHTVTLLALLVWYKIEPRTIVFVACVFLIFGIACFSGSLYLKTLTQWVEIGKLAPVGGSSLAISWLIIAISGKNYL